MAHLKMVATKLGNFCAAERLILDEQSAPLNRKRNVGNGDAAKPLTKRARAAVPALRRPTEAMYVWQASLLTSEHPCKR